MRATKELSVEDVASRLLLSKAQVLGLEAADAAAFYTSAYFLRGLRKYMAFAGVPEELLTPPPADDAAAEDADALRLTLAQPEAGVPEPAAARISGRTWAAAAAMLIVAAAVAGVIRSRSVPTDLVEESDTVRLASIAPLPAQPLRVSTVAARSVEAQPAMDGGSDATVRLSVGKATWVFVRFPDNQVTERRLAAGEEFEVGPLPVYLAIGTADSVELRVEDRPVALEPYIRNGQVRITKPQLAALQDTTPPRP